LNLAFCCLFSWVLGTGLQSGKIPFTFNEFLANFCLFS
jgi:hypothetical protein